MHLNIITFVFLAFASYGLTATSDLPNPELSPGPLGLPTDIPHLESPHGLEGVVNNDHGTRDPYCRPPSQPDRKVQAYPNRQPKQEESPSETEGELPQQPHDESASLLSGLHGLNTVHQVIDDL